MFLIPLLIGFGFNLLSAFTAFFCRAFGEARGRAATFVFRNLLGIPLWTGGLAFAVRERSPRLFPGSLAVETAGWLLLAAGCALIGVALLAIRSRAAAPSTRDSLVTSGPYARVRHPIHSGTLLAIAAVVLLKPTRATALAAAITVGWVLLQSGFEEIDLLQRLPQYRAYMARVPRFIPRLRGPAGPGSRSTPERPAAPPA